MAGWRPIGQTAEEAGALHEGVPEWMARALWEWIERRIVDRPQRGSWSLKADVVDTFEQVRHSRVPVTDEVVAVSHSHGTADAVRRLRHRWDEEKDVIPFVDYLVSLIRGGWEKDSLNTLEEILKRNGSAWKVGAREGYPGLERRVPVGVQEAADHVMANTSHAGDILSEAWHAAFGVNPDPSKAYDRALKAVEAAMKKPVSPNDAVATLTKMKNAIRDQKDWTLPLHGEDPVTPTSLVLLGMVQSLIAGQPDRHAGDGPLPEVSQEAAEAAVMLAVPLVQWFTSGAAARRP